MGRHWISLAVLVAIVPAAGCTSEAKTPAAPSARYLAAIQRAHHAVHIGFPGQVKVGMSAAAFDEAVMAARAVLQEAAGEAKAPVEENSYLVLLACFAKDRQRFQIVRTLREAASPNAAMKEMDKLRGAHSQCDHEFKLWTEPPIPVANGATDGRCLTEARASRAALLNGR